MLAEAVFAVGSTATVFVAVGMVVGAGSWLSDVPRWNVGVRIAVAFVLMGVADIVFGGLSIAWMKERGWIGPKYPFVLKVPDGYSGTAAVEFCVPGGQPLGRVVVADELGIALVSDPIPAWESKWLLDVEHADGSPMRGSAGPVFTWPTGCRTTMVVSATDEGWSSNAIAYDPRPFVDAARRRGEPLSATAVRLPFVVVVPDGYRGDLALMFCDTVTPGTIPETVSVDEIGLATVARDYAFYSATGIEVREVSGRELHGRVSRVEHGQSTCDYLECRVTEAPLTEAPATTGEMIESVVGRVLATGVPYRASIPSP